jgi:hypothetical protein
MSDPTEKERAEVQRVEAREHHQNVKIGHHHGHEELEVVPLQEEALQDSGHVRLSWRTWLLVFVTCFA